MIIRHLNIKNFGTINDRTLEFSPGINVLYGENESERTTIHTYIKSMFFKDISEAICDNAVFVAPLKSATEQDLIRELQKFMMRLLSELLLKMWNNVIKFLEWFIQFIAQFQEELKIILQIRNQTDINRFTQRF